MQNLSKESIEFLGGWLSGGKEITEIPIKVEDELLTYQKNENNNNLEQRKYLYRGILEQDNIKDDIISFDFINSWSYNLDMARNFSYNGQVIKIIVDGSDIFFDTTLLDPEFIIGDMSGFPDEDEVILKPGNYKIIKYYEEDEEEEKLKNIQNFEYNYKFLDGKSGVIRHNFLTKRSNSKE